MKISFDLDDTLIPSMVTDFPVIDRNFYQQMIKVECLRKGTKELFKKLELEGHEIGIYTTSYRPRLKIYHLFRTYGIKVSFVITEKFNRKELDKRSMASSKYPPAFGIDLHIDDSQGVAMEGQRLNFRTIIVEKNDSDWQNKVLSQVSNH